MTMLGNRIRRRMTAVVAAGLMVCATGGVVYAVGIGDLLKIFGVGYVVQRFGPEINTFVNKQMGDRGAAITGATKVVPIISVGRGGYIGAAQVVGVPSKVATVQAVAQVESKFQDRFRMRVLVPISTKTVTGSPKGVSGVGVSAVLDTGI